MIEAKHVSVPAKKVAGLMECQKRPLTSDVTCAMALSQSCCLRVSHVLTLWSVVNVNTGFALLHTILDPAVKLNAVLSAKFIRSFLNYDNLPLPS